MLGRTDIPVAKGMTEPMSRDVPKEPFTHGTDGQAENFLPDPVTPLCKKHACFCKYSCDSGYKTEHIWDY